MSFLGSLFSVIDKIIPNQKKRSISKLKALKRKYAKALEENRDTDAAVYKKMADDLREEMEYAETD